MRSLSTLGFLFFFSTLIKTTADAATLVELELSLNNTVTITLTSEPALVSKAENTGVGFILGSIFGAGGAISDSDPALESGFKSEVSALVRPRVLSITDGIHLFDWSGFLHGNAASTIAGEQAFAGTTTCSLNNPAYSSLLCDAANA